MRRHFFDDLKLKAEYCKIRDALMARNQLFINEKNGIDAMAYETNAEKMAKRVAEYDLLVRWHYPTHMNPLDMKAEGAFIIVKIPLLMGESNAPFLLKEIKHIMQEITKCIPSCMPTGLARPEPIDVALENIANKHIIEKINFHPLKGRLLDPKLYWKAIGVWDMRKADKSWGQIKSELRSDTLDDGRNCYRRAVKYINNGLPCWPPFPK